ERTSKYGHVFFATNLEPLFDDSRHILDDLVEVSVRYINAFKVVAGRRKKPSRAPFDLDRYYSVFACHDTFFAPVPINQWLTGRSPPCGAGGPRGSAPTTRNLSSSSSRAIGVYDVLTCATAWVCATRHNGAACSVGSTSIHEINRRHAAIASRFRS